MAGEFIRYDGLCKDEACEVEGGHFHGDAGWREYWGGLSLEQRDWIKNKATWEGISVSAVATDYGAPAAPSRVDAPAESEV